MVEKSSLIIANNLTTCQGERQIKTTSGKKESKKENLARTGKTSQRAFEEICHKNQFLDVNKTKQKRAMMR